MHDDVVDPEPSPDRLTRLVSAVTVFLGSMPAIVGSVAVIVVWALTGPVFGFSDTWQLIINTSTTIVTFNMVFVIQNTQNRDGRAIQTKLDAIIHALSGTDDTLMGLEELSEANIEEIQAHVRRLASHAATNAPGEKLKSAGDRQ